MEKALSGVLAVGGAVSGRVVAGSTAGAGSQGDKREQESGAHVFRSASAVRCWFVGEAKSNRRKSASEFRSTSCKCSAVFFSRDEESALFTHFGKGLTQPQHALLPSVATA